MDIEAAIRIVSRQAPCPHDSVDRNLGDGATWAKCHDCGGTIRQAFIPRARQAAQEFDDAIDFLRSPKRKDGE